MVGTSFSLGSQEEAERNQHQGCPYPQHSTERQLPDGKNVLVSSAYTGGTTVVDVDKLLAGPSEADAEVGFFRAHGGSAWSSHWYNGHVYANDILRGVDILLLSDSARATTMRFDHFNPQTQLAA